MSLLRKSKSVANYVTPKVGPEVFKICGDPGMRFLCIYHMLMDHKLGHTHRTKEGMPLCCWAVYLNLMVVHLVEVYGGGSKRACLED